MLTRKLGQTDLNLTVIGFGAWAIGGGDYKFGWGPQDDEDSIKSIHEALDAGVNWIDTAPIYGLGRSEQVVGKALKGIRHEVILATKCGIVWDANRTVSRHLKADSIRREVELSLGRLQTDYIDLYQMHWPEPDEIIEEAWEAMVKLVDEGKVRYIAVCNFNVEQLRRIGAIQPAASLQPPYNMLRREIEEDILPYCQESKLGVVAYSPMQNGLLTGKFTLERIQNLPDDDFRKTLSEQFQSPQLDVNLKVVEGLRPIAQRLDHTLAQLALAWVLRRPEVTSAITGARKPGQIKETAMAAGWVLDEWTVQQIEALLNKRDKVLAEANA
ncbi:MAG: aldo/keto reductase [Candidatus Marinimicrobia bacterium]|nr:aldo/keto reductase [Candidatus Neomarinimicrobiota bacterium]MCH7859039.1 aldo/keto reductase [Candidatus Neomarinimicrobiota bacterium]